LSCVSVTARELDDFDPALMLKSIRVQRGGNAEDMRQEVRAILYGQWTTRDGAGTASG